MQGEHIRFIPNQEYYLQGSILDSAVDHLIHRPIISYSLIVPDIFSGKILGNIVFFKNYSLDFQNLKIKARVFEKYEIVRYFAEKNIGQNETVIIGLKNKRLKGLCDNVDIAPENFQDSEVCLSIRQPNGVPLSLRVRRALDREAPFQLRYIGQPELGAARPTLVRSSIDVSCTSTILEFLNELGFRIDFEYASRGVMFRKGRMKITISKIVKVGKQQDNEPISQSYLVELSVLAPNGQDAIGEEMRLFAEQLKPLVQLEKIDYKRLGVMP